MTAWRGRRAWARVALVAYLVLVGWLLLSPGAPGPQEAGSVDKLGHLGAGLGLGVLVWAALPGGPARAAWTLGAGLLFALVTELGQAFVPGRDPEVLDALADVVGTALALVILAGVASRRQAHGS